MLRNTRKTMLLLAIFATLLFVIGCQEGPQEKVQEEPKTTNLNQLLGKWQSVDNPKNQIELTKTRMFSYFGDLKLADESLIQIKLKEFVHLMMELFVYS